MDTLKGSKFVRGRRLGFADFDVGNLRVRRAALRPRDDGIDRFRRAAHHGLDRAIAAIAHPSVNAELLCLLTH